MSGFTPEEWRTAARVARRSIFTEGNPDLADAWDKAADQAEARLIPAGGMALTAEQVEDVRTVVFTKSGSDTYLLAGETVARLRALFPATEPAEVNGNIVAECNSSTGDAVASRAQDITRSWMRHLGYSDGEVDSLEHAKHEDFGCEREDGGWSCYGESGDSLHKDWDEYDAAAQLVMFVLDPAPAEPAEEETKAEYPHRGLGDLTVLGPEVFTNGDIINWRGENFVRQQGEGICSTKFDGDRVYHCALADGHYGDHTTAHGEHWQKRPASSPVVPAPTETGPLLGSEDTAIIRDVIEQWRDTGKPVLRESTHRVRLLMRFGFLSQIAPADDGDYYLPTLQGERVSCEHCNGTGFDHETAPGEHADCQWCPRITVQEWNQS